MDWVLLITTLLPVVLDLIKECRQEQPRGDVLDRMKRFSFREKWALGMRLRKEGYRGRDLREALQAVESHVEDCKAEGSWDGCCEDLVSGAEAAAADEGLTLVQ